MARKVSKAKKQEGTFLSRQREKLEQQRNRRINLLKKTLDGISDPEDMMLEIMNVLTETELIPDPGNYYTFVYRAKTIKDKAKQYSGMPTEEVYYDQHPLVAVMEVKSWGFKGLNFHWGTMRNYTWEEVLGRLHLIYSYEIDYFRSLNYAKLIKYGTK